MPTRWKRPLGPQGRGILDHQPHQAAERGVAYVDLHRAGLGKRVDEAMSEIIDVEHEVVDEPVEFEEAPRLVPSIEPSRNATSDEEEE